MAGRRRRWRPVPCRPARGESEPAFAVGPRRGKAEYAGRTAADRPGARPRSSPSCVGRAGIRGMDDELEQSSRRGQADRRPDQCRSGPGPGGTRCGGLGRGRLTMLVYRVFPYLPAARPGEPGHPLYQHRPQRGGRIDHPDYHVWYLSRQPEAAVGETFGNLAVWDRSMFSFPLLPGSQRALGVFRLPDDLRLLDLDDPRVLVELGLRPTQIVTRNLAVTQQWGHRIWSQRDPHDPSLRRWQAITWWSYHRPTWEVLGCWLTPEFDHVEEIDLGHVAVREAAAALHRVP